MAKTVQECYNEIVTTLTAQFSSAGITINPDNWSNANVLRNICWAVATGQSLSEQNIEVYLNEIEQIQSLSAAASLQWVQYKMFQFQYSATNPQVLSYVDGLPTYDPINEAYRIITACSVTKPATSYVAVKLAKGSTTLSALTSLELASAQDYIDTIGDAGTTYSVTSTDPDRLYIEGTIYYDGGYASVIQTNVIAAIDNYLKNLSLTEFGGSLKLSDLRNFIRNIEGVTDISLVRVSCRTESQALFDGIDLVLASDEIERKYVSEAGYLIQEDTASSTFADTLTFTVDS